MLRSKRNQVRRRDDMVGGNNKETTGLLPAGGAGKDAAGDDDGGGRRRKWLGILAAVLHNPFQVAYNFYIQRNPLPSSERLLHRGLFKVGDRSAQQGRPALTFLTRCWPAPSLQRRSRGRACLLLKGGKTKVAF